MVRYQDRFYRISDFTYHIQIVKFFTFSEFGDLYSPHYQVKALSALRGPTDGAMPIGLSPSFLVIFLPFALIAKLDFKLAQALWMGLSFLVLLTGLKNHLAQIGAGLRSYSVTVPLLLLLLTVPLTRSTALGQPSIFAAGALLMLATRRSINSKSWAIDALLLFGLTLKAPYFLIGSLIALGSQKFRALLASVLLLLVSAATLTILTGSEWFESFVTTHRSYQTGLFSPLYTDTIVQRDSLIFSNSFSSYLDPQIGRQFSWWILAISFGCSLALVILSKANHLAIYGVLVAYLLFSPYAGLYENVLILAALPLLNPSQPSITPYFGILLFLTLCGTTWISPEVRWVVGFLILLILGSVQAALKTPEQRLLNSELRQS